MLFLAGGAGALLVAFGGITDRLIPLFAVEAFLSFTLSQAGMAAHWRNALRKGRRHGASSAYAASAKLTINGLGALATGVALAIILAGKFLSGPWLTLIVIPVVLLLLRKVRRYYDDLDQLVLRGSQRTIDPGDHIPPTMLVPIERWDSVACKAVEFALRLSPDVSPIWKARTPRTSSSGCARSGGDW